MDHPQQQSKMSVPIDGCFLQFKNPLLLCPYGSPSATRITGYHDYLPQSSKRGKHGGSPGGQVLSQALMWHIALPSTSIH